MLNNINLDQEIENISNDIKKISKSNNINKNIAKYNKNIKKLIDIKLYLDDIQNKINNVNIIEANTLINNYEFIQYLDELNNIQINFDESSNLNDIITLYYDCINKINLCKKYLEETKLSITYLE
jgi:hypothetical protein